MRGCLTALAALAVLSVGAGSNVDPAHHLARSDLIGSLDWRPNDQNGVVISQFYCSGYIYGHSVGWISLGAGQPENGVSYANSSRTDFGVNVSPSGQLTGFAYGANIGWINFVPAGNPRVDWASGRLSGAAWSANVGWLPLADTAQYLRIQARPELPDADKDDLPDAWEIESTGTLTALTGAGDRDEDGQSDLQEYLAGTNPKDKNDFLGPLRLTVAPGVKELQFPTKPSYIYQVEQRSTFGSSGSWTRSPITPALGDGNTMSVLLQEEARQLLFYRVVAYPPLSELN